MASSFFLGKDDWHAYGDNGAQLPVLKADAGLTAIWIPLGTVEVT